MIEHLVLFQLVADISPEKVEWMLRETRLRLLKIPCVLAVRCGTNLDASAPWAFFLSVVVETPEKLAAYSNDPTHKKFVAEVIKPNTSARLALDFQTVPGGDPLYS